MKRDFQEDKGYGSIWDPRTLFWCLAAERSYRRRQKRDRELDLELGSFEEESRFYFKSRLRASWGRLNPGLQADLLCNRLFKYINYREKDIFWPRVCDPYVLKASETIVKWLVGLGLPYAIPYKTQSARRTHRIVPPSGNPFPSFFIHELHYEAAWGEMTFPTSAMQTPWRSVLEEIIIEEDIPGPTALQFLKYIGQEIAQKDPTSSAIRDTLIRTALETTIDYVSFPERITCHERPRDRTSLEITFAHKLAQSVSTIIPINEAVMRGIDKIAEHIAEGPHARFRDAAPWNRYLHLPALAENAKLPYEFPLQAYARGTEEEREDICFNGVRAIMKGLHQKPLKDVTQAVKASIRERDFETSTQYSFVERDAHLILLHPENRLTHDEIKAGENKYLDYYRSREARFLKYRTRDHWSYSRSWKIHKANGEHIELKRFFSHARILSRAYRTGCEVDAEYHLTGMEASLQEWIEKTGRPPSRLSSDHPTNISTLLSQIVS